MDEGDDFGFSGRDMPGAAEEIDGIVGIKSVLEMERQVEVQEGGGWQGA